MSYRRLSATHYQLVAWSPRRLRLFLRLVRLWAAWHRLNGRTVEQSTDPASQRTVWTAR